MGYIKEKTGMTLLGTPEGTCRECGVRHDPELPHNKHSLAYQYNFFDKHGRWPTWSDAMAHCSEEIKEMWAEELMKRGEELNN